MGILRFLLFATLSFTLQACVNIQTKTIDHEATLALYEQHQQNVANIQQFAFKARIGVQADGKGFSGSVDWQHQPTTDVITLYSPFGGEVANIQKNTNSVTLTNDKGNSISATNVETLTEQALGWILPLDGLTDWSLGRASNSPIQEKTWDSEGHLSNLKQSGWEIEYQNYSIQQGYNLPSKILFKNQKINLKLIISDWYLIGI